MEEQIKVLGLNWDTTTDSLNIINPKWKSFPTTMRELCSEVSTIYDPLNLLSPLNIRAKMLMQDCWKSELKWDQSITQEIKDNWKKLREELVDIEQIKIPRCVARDSGDLHIFCDASMKAFGAVAYIVAEGQCNLLTSKARVAPIKTRTLPQLELAALLIGARLARWIVETINIKLCGLYLWTDNEACLQWVKNNKCTNVFVKNRVAEIRRLQRQFSFSLCHVASNCNPADLLSRGITLKALKTSDLWWHGPSWITDQSEWPTQKEHVMSETTVGPNLERLFTAMEITTEQVTRCEKTVEKFLDDERFSSWRSLRSTTAVIFKFLRLKFNVCLSAETYWLRYIQMEYFPVVRKILNNGEKKPNDHPSQKLIDQLYLYLDNNGVIKSRGRVEKSVTNFGHDLVLSSPNSHVMKLYVKYVHETNKHSGENQTLAALRQQLWIPQARVLVKNVLEKCTICRRYNGPLLSQPGPPQLPAVRVNFKRPFCNIGVDYSGAIWIREEDSDASRKVYICLITCMASRAVHLEIARDNSAITFINLFRRFVAKWGLPETVTSDNAANFTNTAELLVELSDNPEVRYYFRTINLNWHFIHARSPWEGGFYERLVGVVKKCLKLCMHNKTFNYDDIVTLLSEVSSRVNNRPLCYLSSNRESIEALTPNHLLFGYTIDCMPPLEPHEDDQDYISRNHLMDYYAARSCLLEQFENIWRTQYLTALRERHYPCAKGQSLPVKVGSIVILETPSNRDFWPMGKVLELVKDTEGFVRSVKVLSRGVTYTRTLNKLVLLEMDPSLGNETLISNADLPSLPFNPDVPVKEKYPVENTADEPSRKEDEQVMESDPEVSVRPKRKAAIRAKLAIKRMTNDE